MMCTFDVADAGAREFARTPTITRLMTVIGFVIEGRDERCMRRNDGR
jgi:hypothetical protein